MHASFRIGCSLVIGAIGLLLAPPPPARADGPAPPPDRAQALLDRGNDLFIGGDHAGALRAYQESYEISKSAKLFFNLGRCEESLGKPALALEHFTRFLQKASDVEPEVRAYAEEHSRALAQGVVTVEVVGAPASSAVRIGDEAPRMTPLEHPIWVAPGTHRIRVDRPGVPPWVSSLEGRAGSKVSVVVPPPLPPEPQKGADVGSPGPAASDVPITHRWWLWAGVGVVVIGGVVAGILLTRCPATYCQ